MHLLDQLGNRPLLLCNSEAESKFRRYVTVYRFFGEDIEKLLGLQIFLITFCCFIYTAFMKQKMRPEILVRKFINVMSIGTLP